MRIWRTRLREGAAVTIVIVLVAVVVVVALRADARSSVRTVVNDGGAWLVKGDAGVVGHVNRASMEITGVVSAAEPGADFDVEQDGQLVVVHDRTTSSLILVDPRTHVAFDAVAVPDGVRHAATSGGAVVWRESPLAVWMVTRDQLASIASLDEVAPIHESTGDGLVTVTRNGGVIALDRSAGKVISFDAAGAEGRAPSPLSTSLPDGADDLTALSAIGDDAVILDGDRIAVVELDGQPSDIADAFASALTLDAELGGEVVLAQPATTDAPVVVVHADGTIVRGPVPSPDDSDADTATPAALEPTGSLGAAQPLPPIVHEGCVFALAREPVVLTRTCPRAEPLREELANFNANTLRLRLVNGWVWINDLSFGRVAVLGTTGEVSRLDDWGLSGGDADIDDDPEANDGDDKVDLEQDVVFEDKKEEVDENDVNDPPIANDDVARTRTDTPIVVDVLDNDADPDGDVIAVTSIGDIPARTQVAPNADRTAVQLTPPAGFEGTLGFEYEITDGRALPDGRIGADTARVEVEVVDATSNNQPPVPVEDRVEAVSGRSVMLNLLDNDDDPDGDVLSLESVDDTRGALSWDPTGRVTFVPPPTDQRGAFDIRYVVRDTFGATAEGVIAVVVRPPGANNEPVANHDSRATVVERPVAFNVLANDSDPDSDPLSVAPIPEPLGRLATGTPITLSADGEVVVSPRRPGTYRWRYTVSDTLETDMAVIRIDVAESTDNRQPTAVRDDVTIARGASRTVYVLQNDVDPDGDVVALETWRADEGVDVEERPGSGFSIAVGAKAPDEVRVHYSITDGVTDPVPGVVVVAVSDRDVDDQAPVALPDLLDVRARRTGEARVLVNDYDPEGGALTLVRASPTPDAEVRIGPGGQDVYITPKADVRSSFSVAYDIADEAGNTASSFVLVRPVARGQANRPPVARPDELRARAGTRAVIDAAANDSDPDGDAVRVESISAPPAMGEALLRDDGTIAYRAAPDAMGTDRFEYLLVDARGGRAVGVVIVGVLPAKGPNRPPTATDDLVRVIAGSDPLVLDLLSNDFDANGDTVTVTDVSGSGERIAFDDRAGTVTFDPPGRIRGGDGTFTFRYSIDDGRGLTDRAKVTVVVTDPAGNLAPVAVDDIVGPVLENTTIDVAVLSNDFDPDGSRSDLTLTTDAAGVRVDGDRLRIDVGDESGEYAYTITDPGGGSARGVVTVITTPNRPPRIEPTIVETDFEEPVVIDLEQQVREPDGDDLSFDCCTRSRHGAGSVSDDDASRVRFRPDDGFDGEAGFAYTVDDGNGHEVGGTLVVRVRPPHNRPPVAEDGEHEVEAGEVGSVSLAALVDDPDLTTGDELRFSIVDDAGAGGELRGSTWRIAPDVDAAGSSYRVEYRVRDRAGESATATVTVTVIESSQPPPVAVDDLVSTTDTEVVTVDVGSNDEDPLGEGLTVVASDVVSGSGTAEPAGGSSIRFAPTPESAGRTTVRYTIADRRGTAGGEAVALLVVDIVAPPGRPPAPRAIADRATVTVTWSTPERNGAAIEGYEVTNERGQAWATGPQNSLAIEGLAMGVSQRFSVRARNEAGWGSPSEPSAPVTPDVEPAAPAAPTVQFADQALIVRWTRPVSDGSPIETYLLSIGGAMSMTMEVGNRTEFRWEGLVNGSDYQFTVVAVNAAGRSPPSAPSAPEHPLRQPGPPSVPAVAVGDGSLALEFTSGDTGGDPITRYEIQRRRGGVEETVRPSYVWSGLRNGVAEQFRVRASNRDPDPGSWSDWSRETTPCGAPATPAAPQVTRDNEAVQVQLQAPDDRGCEITSYSIVTDTGVRQTTDQLRARIAPLQNGTPYRFQVSATNSQGDSAVSAWSPQVTPAGPPIGPPSATADPTGVGEITVTWSPADDNGSALTSYQIAINDGAPFDVSPGTTSWTHRGLGPGATYDYKVSACNDVDCGNWSSSDTATTWSPPSSPGQPNLTPNDRSLTATWSSPASDGGTPVTGYSVRLNGQPSSFSSSPASWDDLQYGQDYTVDVAACNDVGCSAPGPINTVTIRGAPAQMNPPVLSSTTTTVTATWTTPQMNGSSLSGFELDITPISGSADTSTSGSSYTFQGLTPETTYEVKVRACSSDEGCGPWSNSASTTTAAANAVTIRRGSECGPNSPSGQPCNQTAQSCQDVCNYIHVTATGFEPNTVYEYRCYRNGREFQGYSTRTTNGSGAYVGDIGCFSATAGTYHITFGTVRSNDDQW